MLNRLERLFGRLAIPHLAMLMAIGEAITLAYGAINPRLYQLVSFDASRLLQGEYWRLFSFLVMTPSQSILFGGFAIYLFYLYGSTLEASWGEFRFNVYVFIAALMTIGVGFILPGVPFGVGIIHTSVFLAFAYLNPDFEISIFFVLPVKVKYIALFIWCALGVMFLVYPLPIKAIAVGTATNFLVFFWRDILTTAKSQRRRTAHQARAARGKNMSLHVCCVCGATEQSHPNDEFRVCSECTGGREYCSRHLDGHKHI